MDSESAVIHQQMEDTRSSLQDKLETLEQQVTDTMHNATEAVSDTVDSVKGAVQDTVDSVKDTFDVSRQVDRHPWAIVLGAALVGFVGARLLDRVLAPRQPALALPVSTPLPAVSHNSHSTAANGKAPAAPTQTLWNVLAEEYSEELAKIKGLAVSTVGVVVREMIAESVSPALSERVKELVDGVTVKLGGHPLDGSFFTAWSHYAGARGEPKDTHDTDLHRMADDGCPLSEPDGAPSGARFNGNERDEITRASKL